MKPFIYLHLTQIYTINFLVFLQFFCFLYIRFPSSSISILFSFFNFKYIFKILSSLHLFHSSLSSLQLFHFVTNKANILATRATTTTSNDPLLKFLQAIFEIKHLVLGLSTTKVVKFFSFQIGFLISTLHFISFIASSFSISQKIQQEFHQ